MTAPTERQDAVGALRFGLIGEHIAYSASPAMMTAAFAALGLPHAYGLIDIAEADVPGAVDELRRPGAGGANVTTPHKRLVASLMDELSPDAERAGAVNCVVPRDGRLVGHNTDLPALIAQVAALRPGGPDRAVVLGGGGAAGAVLLALEGAGARDVVSLTRSGGTWDRMADELARADMVVNATPIGTGADETPVPAGLHRSDLAVLDLVYRPSPTRLVREARAAGAPARAGGGMLLGQAIRSLELWLGVPAPVTAMRDALVASVGDGVDA
ncbi:MAG: shikimate dehydrogenase [Candidatus Limnocylindrales bacterium]